MKSFSVFLGVLLLVVLYSVPSYGSRDYIKNESIACVSESLFKEQIKMIIDGQRRLINGCRIVTGEPYVDVIDLSLLWGPSKVRLNNGQVLFLDSGSIGLEE